MVNSTRGTYVHRELRTAAGARVAWISPHEPGALVVRVDPDEQSLIAAASPELFFVTPHYRRLRLGGGQARGSDRPSDPIQLRDRPLVAEIAGVQGAARLEEHHVRLRLRDRQVLDAARN